MTRRIKAKPQIKKREAMQLAQQAESDPLGVLQQIAERERHTVTSISIWGGHGKEWLLEWRCSLSFSGAAYAAGGKGETAGAAVKQAILRAYDTGAEKDWQLREKSFQGGGLS
jgi:hypothetical protein